MTEDDADQGNLETATVDRLNEDVQKTASVSDISANVGPGPLTNSQVSDRQESFRSEMNRAESDRRHQQNELRPKLFHLAAWLSWIVILGNFAIVGWYCYFAKADIDADVLKFWISSTVLEVLGIVYIIAQYLFPKPATQTGVSARRR